MTADQRLFVPFKQGEDWLTRRTGGAGLGLVISKRLCELLNGEITVESEPGRGSDFVVRLPTRALMAPDAPGR